jgi:uncharacterized damage-inducible protein DinB
MTLSPHLDTALSDILHQGLNLLQRIDQKNYTHRLPVAFGSSIGGHYRHCLDHFDILLSAQDAGEICFDQRRRDPRVENERDFALAATHLMIGRVHALPGGWSDVALQTRTALEPHSGAPISVSSSLGREAVYVITHAIHHYALIRVMCALLKVSLPGDFGVAPSTLQYQRAASTS